VDGVLLPPSTTLLPLCHRFPRGTKRELFRHGYHPTLSNRFGLSLGIP
jgi:hypothetical protein